MNFLWVAELSLYMETMDKPCAVVVDDDAIILMDAAAILEDAGFQVFTAMDAGEALQHLSEGATWVTVLFTDVDMPGSIDGFGLARHTAQVWPDIAILVASGRRSPGPADMPPRALFIPKPFSSEVVHQHLCKVVAPDRQPGPLRGKGLSR